MHALPNSARYWRCNTIAALNSLNLNESTAADPAQLAQIRADKAELETLLAMEQRLKARHDRMHKGAL